jgi:hypothetical protein
MSASGHVVGGRRPFHNLQMTHDGDSVVPLVLVGNLIENNRFAELLYCCVFIRCLAILVYLAVI